jgi:HEPN domain-containing protein
MARKSDTAEVLLAHAAEDELASRSLLSVEGITDSAIGFHAQQAVEKSIKAVLSARQIEYPYVHDIDGLIELAQSNGIEVPIELSDADYLTPFAVRLRYGAAPTADLDCDQALAGPRRQSIGHASGSSQLKLHRHHRRQQSSKTDRRWGAPDIDGSPSRRGGPG